MDPFDEEEKRRKELESRLADFRRSERSSKEFTPWRGLYLVSSLGLVVAVSLILGLGLGVYLDGRFGTKPWLSLCGLVLGLAAAGKTAYELVRSAMINKD